MRQHVMWGRTSVPTVSAICKSTLLLGASNERQTTGRQTDRPRDRRTKGDKCSDAAVKCLNFLKSSLCCCHCCCCCCFCCWPTAKTVEPNCEAHFLCECDCDCQMSTELSNETLTFDRRTQNTRSEKKEENIFKTILFCQQHEIKGKIAAKQRTVN